MNKQLFPRLRASARSVRRVTAHTLALAIMCALSGCGASSEQHVACPAIDVSAVAAAPGDSTRAGTMNDGTKIPLVRSPLVTTADLTGATASLTEGEWVLNLDLTDDAAKRIQVFSRQNVGRTLALVVDGNVRGTPKIMDALTGKGLLIGGFKEADAKQMAAAISNGCRP